MQVTDKPLSKLRRPLEYVHPSYHQPRKEPEYISFKLEIVHGSEKGFRNGMYIRLLKGCLVS